MATFTRDRALSCAVAGHQRALRRLSVCPLVSDRRRERRHVAGLRAFCRRRGPRARGRPRSWRSRAGAIESHHCEALGATDSRSVPLS